MKAKVFEQQFDEAIDITASLDLSKKKRVLQVQRRVNIDFPTWMIESLDREAGKLGVTRQSIYGSQCVLKMPPSPSTLCSRWIYA